MKEKRKYLLVWIAIGVLLYAGLWCRSALAEEPPAPDVLEIANDFVGDGMDSSYSGGYIPVIADGSVRVVLPLRPADPEEAPAEIQVVVELDDAAAPFVVANYDMRVPLTPEAESGGGLYLIALSLPLEEGAAGGRYPVSFTCSGRTGSGSFSQKFTVFVTVPLSDDFSDPDPDPGADGGEAGADASGGGHAGGEAGGASESAPTPEPTPAPQPKLMVVSEAVSPSPVEAGAPFTVTVLLKNTSAQVPVQNLLLTAEGDGEEIYAQDGTSSAYFAKVAPGETVSFAIPLQAAPEASPGPKRVALHASYDGPQGSPYTQDEYAACVVYQPVRFAVDEPDFPSELQAGDTWSLPVNVMNLGRGPIRNVSAHVEAPGIRTQSTLFLGNLESGTAKQGTLFAFVGPKSELEGEARYGSTSGMLTVTCEDEAGASYSSEYPFELAIAAPVIRSERQEEEPPEEEPALAWQVPLLIGAAIAVGAAYLWLRQRHRGKKHDAEP